MRDNLMKLQAELESKKNATGLVGTRLSVNEVPGNSMSASMSFDWKNINLSLGEELELVPDERTKAFAYTKGIVDAERKVCEDVLEHEAGHRENPARSKRGCPFTLEMHEAIKESIYKGLKNKGKEGFCDSVTNAFEDILDNVNCRTRTDFSGQTLFWNNQGLVNSKDGKYSPFYEAFVRANLALGGGVRDYTFLSRFFKGERKVADAVKGFLGDVKGALNLEHAVKIHDKPEIEKLFSRDMDEREKLWSFLAESFAQRTAELLDKTPPEKMFGASIGSGSSGKDGKDDENPFDKDMKSPANRQAIAVRRYEQGKGPAVHRDKQEQLYDLYRAISKEIPVETSHYTQAQSMPLVHFGRRMVREDEELSPRAKIKGIGINDKGELSLKTTRHSIDFPVSYKVHPRKFPNLKIALMDRSGSMGLGVESESEIGSAAFIPWGDKCRYHFALKGYFGVDNFLERQGVAPYVECVALGFSGESAMRGNSRDVAKSLLESPSGGTSFDSEGLERELDSSALVLSISDGEVELDKAGARKIESKIRTGDVDFAHIQIGRETEFSLYLRNLGVPVFYVRGDEDLARTMVSFVASKYKSYLPQKGGNAK